MSFSKCKIKIISLSRDTVGAVAVIWALAIPLVVGCIGLGMDVGSWYFAKRNLQNAVDLAAVSAGYDIRGSNPQQTTMYYTANNEMVRAGFTSGVTLTVNYPPQSGTYAGNTSAVEVIAVQPQSRFFSGISLSSNPNALVRAVGLTQSTTSGGGCILSLATSGAGINITGSSTLTMPDCILVSNSNSNESINLSGSTNTSIGSIYTKGNYNQSGSSNLTIANTPTIHGSTTSDPYSSLTVPSFSGCDRTNYKGSPSSIAPGVYCGGMTLGNHDTANLDPGVYIINGGQIKMTNGSTLNGTGVTFILTGGATVSLEGGTTNISAPTTGDYAGIALYQDRDSEILSSKFNGGSTMNFTGAIYMPKGDLTFNGGNSSGGACMQLVMNTVEITGNNSMTSNCPSSGMSAIGPATGVTVSLVE